MREGARQEAGKEALPLHGLRVLDLSRVFAGPWCGQVLADLGAEVIKIEHPERGDDTRDWGIRIGETETTYYNAMNRNKKSVALDLSKPDGLDALERLVSTSDVVLHNFRCGVAERLGIGYDELKRVKPDLIYCAISGYDSDGPEAKRPGYDIVIQAEAGLMAVNGEAGGPPLKFGLAIVDLATGMFAANGILAALHRRERTGFGQLVELSLFDCGIALTSYFGLDALERGFDTERYGNTHPSVIPYGLFDTADGPLIIAVGNNAQFRRLCEHVLDAPGLANDPRFATNTKRSENGPELLDALGRLFQRSTRAELLRRLNEAGIPSGEVSGLHEALTSDRVARSSLVQLEHHPMAGPVPLISPPYKLDGRRVPIRRLPPVLGEDTADILRDAGSLSQTDLSESEAAATVSRPSPPRAEANVVPGLEAGLPSSSLAEQSPSRFQPSPPAVEATPAPVAGQHSVVARDLASRILSMPDAGGGTNSDAVALLETIVVDVLLGCAPPGAGASLAEAFSERVRHQVAAAELVIEAPAGSA